MQLILFFLQNDIGQNIEGGAAQFAVSEENGTEQDQGRLENDMVQDEKLEDDGEVAIIEHEQQHSQLLEEKRFGEVGNNMVTHENWLN